MKKLIIAATVLAIASMGSAFAADKKAPAKKSSTSSAPAATHHEETTTTSNSSARSEGASTKGHRNYGMAGCGLGSVLISKGGSQVFAWSTNATSWTQLFGITMGTSNCDASSNKTASLRVPAFVAANQITLADDIARGNGETLMTLSSVLGCQDSMMLGSKLQQNFSAIYPSEQVGVEQVSDSILSIVNQDAQLAQSCNALI